MTIKKTGRNDHNKRQAATANKKAVMHMTLPLFFSQTTILSQSGCL